MRNILYYENRIHLLEQRGSVMNANLIKKCRRQLRRLQAQS